MLRFDIDLTFIWHQMPAGLAPVKAPAHVIGTSQGPRPCHWHQSRPPAHVIGTSQGPPMSLLLNSQSLTTWAEECIISLLQLPNIQEIPKSQSSGSWPVTAILTCWEVKVADHTVSNNMSLSKWQTKWGNMLLLQESDCHQCIHSEKHLPM